MAAAQGYVTINFEDTNIRSALLLSGLGRPGEGPIENSSGFVIRLCQWGRGLPPSRTTSTRTASGCTASGFRVQDPHGTDPAVRETALQGSMEAMDPPRFFSLGSDGSLIERDSP